MTSFTQSQWHLIAAADDIVELDGQIVGVVMDDVECWFSACYVAGKYWTVRMQTSANKGLPNGPDTPISH